MILIKYFLLILLTITLTNSTSIVSSDSSFSTQNQCEGKPVIQEWIKQRKQIKYENNKDNFLQVTVSRIFSEELKRLVHSAEIYNRPYVIIGLCEEWKRENILSESLITFKQMIGTNFDKMMILYTHPSTLFVNSPLKMSKFYLDNFAEGTILFKAERLCYPKGLESQFKSSQKFKYLNTQIFLAPANQLLKLFEESPLDNFLGESFDLSIQKYMVNSFLNLKNIFRMLIDSNRKVFASSYGIDEEDSYHIKSENGTNQLIWRTFDYVINEISDSSPVLIGGVLPFFLNVEDGSKQKIKEGTYIKNMQKDGYDQSIIVKQTTKAYGKEIKSDIDSKFNLFLLQNFFPSTDSSPSPLFSSTTYPTFQSKETNKIMLGVFLNDQDIFVRLIFEGIENLNYDKSNIALFINYKQTSKHANKEILEWIDKVENAQGTPGNYFLVIRSSDQDISKVKREALIATLKHECDYYFTTESALENKETLNHLIGEKKKFIGPMMTLPLGSTYSNFWCKINWKKQGFKKHSLYIPIVQKEHVGTLRIPIVWGTFLIHSSIITQISDNYLQKSSEKSKVEWEKVLDRMETFKLEDDWWIDIIFAVKTSYELDDGIWLTNKEHFGYLIDKDLPHDEENKNENGKVHKELYAYKNNKYLFKKYYYSPNFFDFAINGKHINYTEPCIDAFAWIFMNPIFGEHLIEEAENFGKWSGGGHNSHYDPRIGGTESYPTQDIHLNQFGLHEMWLDIVKTDIAEAADMIYDGVVTKGINIAFIVRYKPGVQSFLKPHHDSSLYTVSIALNKPQRDFEGGGVRYVRRNCTYIPPESGYSIVHPGRVTHKHEGLETTNGTRYIFVSFIN